MGMYDEVYIECPRCKHMVYKQSKAYDCTLSSYTLPDDCPIAIAADLQTEDIVCEECGTRIEIEIDYVVRIKEAGEKV